MTTLPEELRKLAKANDAQVRADRDGASNSYYSGCREAFQRAAELVEADPLHKAAGSMRDALRLLLDAAPYYPGHPRLAAPIAAAQRALDSLPKEG